MRFRVFTYPVPPPEDLEDLNAFLASAKILSVRSEIVLKDATPYVLFIVEYLESGKMERKPKVDYREKLSEEDFQAFSRLRDLRKTLADREGVPVYAVLTNAQLAEMVEKRVKAAQDMLAISGIGQGKVDKYGSEFLQICSKILSRVEDKDPE